MPTDIERSVISSNTTKQQTSEWFALREKVYVTGSTPFKALGLDSLKEPKMFYKQSVLNLPLHTVPTKILTDALQWGT